MLLPSFFILDFEKIDNLPDIELAGNTFLCYRVTDFSVSESGRFNKKILLSYKNRFCLSVDIDKIETDFEKKIEFLISFTFFYSYLRVGYDKPLIVFETGKDNAAGYCTIAKEIFKSHGYNDLEIIVVYSVSKTGLDNNAGKAIIFNLNSNNNLSIEYTNTVKEITSADSSLFFFINDPQELPAILSILEQSGSLIQEKFPQTYYLLEENRIIKAREQKMLSEMVLYRERIDSENSYHLSNNAGDTRYKRQVKELLRFYKNEYEILPKWYKQFGHIIKVIMGKRTFSSLFNDNVKKYKD